MYTLDGVRSSIFNDPGPVNLFDIRSIGIGDLKNNKILVGLEVELSLKPKLKKVGFLC